MKRHTIEKLPIFDINKKYKLNEIKEIITNNFHLIKENEDLQVKNLIWFDRYAIDIQHPTSYHNYICRIKDKNRIRNVILNHNNQGTLQYNNSLYCNEHLNKSLYGYDFSDIYKSLEDEIIYMLSKIIYDTLNNKDYLTVSKKGDDYIVQVKPILKNSMIRFKKCVRPIINYINS